MLIVIQKSRFLAMDNHHRPGQYSHFPEKIKYFLTNNVNSDQSQKDSSLQALLSQQLI